MNQYCEDCEEYGEWVEAENERLHGKVGRLIDLIRGVHGHLLDDRIDAALAGTAPPTVLFDDRRDDPYLSPVGDQPPESLYCKWCNATSRPGETQCPVCGDGAADQQFPVTK